MNIVKKEIILPDGRVITLETGKLAKQADGAVMATLGNTMVLATVCSAKDAVPGTDFMPLTVSTKRNFLQLVVSQAVSLAARVKHLTTRSLSLVSSTVRCVLSSQAIITLTLS